MFKEKDEDDLARKIITLSDLPAERKKEIKKINREIIIKNHNLKNLVKNITDVFAS
jgi:glycosyltransferase involved in cell wall biosynthesis